MNNISVIVACALYFLMLLSIGIATYYHSKRAQHDFSSGGHSLNFWITAIAAHASDMSAWLFMGFPAAIYADGLGKAWTAIGLVLGMFINWHYVAPRLRIKGEKYGSTTLSSYLQHHFQDETGLLRLIGALMAIFFFTVYLSSGFVGLGHVFEASIGIDYYTGMLIALGIAIIYTMLGGFVAVAWNDFFQGIFLLIVIVTVPLITWLQLNKGVFWQTDLLPQNWQYGFSVNAVQSNFEDFLLAIGWGIGYFGQPHILNKFMGIDDVKKMRYAKYVGISWQIITLTAAVCIGIVGMIYFKEGLENPELLFIVLVKQTFHPFLATLMLCAIIAASLSSIDAQILVSASILAEDLYKHVWNKTASPLQVKRICRVAIILIPLAALLLAISNKSNVYHLVYYAWSGLGSVFGPLVIVSLIQRKFSAQSAVRGMITGGIVAGLLPFIHCPIPTLVVGFTANLLAISLPTGKKAET